jgi:peptidoglycan/LPS O-acetylase OafA/YrhL
LSVVAFLFPKKTGVVYPILAAAAGITWFFSPDPEGYVLSQMFGLGATFFVGATIRSRDLLSRVSNRIAGVLVLTLVAGAFLDHLYARPLLWTLLPVTVLWVGSHRSRLGTRVAEAGDISYGVYLWAFPVQQIVISTLGEPLGFYGTMVVAVAIVTGLGTLSMKLVEVPALRLRPRRAGNSDVRQL